MEVRFLELNEYMHLGCTAPQTNFVIVHFSCKLQNIDDK